MKKTLLITAHILFWTIVLSFFCFFVGPNVAKNAKIASPNFYIFVHFGIYGIVNISIFYVSLFWVVPNTIDKKKYLWFIFSLICLLIVYGFVKYAIALNFEEYYLTVGPAKKEISRNFWDYFFSTIIPSGFLIFFSLVYKVVVDWFKNENIQKELTAQKTQAELQFLKSQINPHFLFNSLNNIYALAYKKSDDTASAILKLSDIMRYMLNESDDDKVDLQDELAYLRSYIDLNKLRYKDDIYIEIIENIDQPNYRVMPLMLISFVENIFKHGEVSNPEKPVRIKVEVLNSVLVLTTANQIKNGNKDDSSGIGLKNVIRRLDLLYPMRYSLDISNDNLRYSVTLEIKL